MRDKVILAAGGTQVTPEIAVEQGMDAGFGRSDRGVNVATFLVEKRRELQNK
jgi:D-ornithine 4,5-aminomutase subunit beta